MRKMHIACRLRTAVLAGAGIVSLVVLSGLSFSACESPLLQEIRHASAIMGGGTVETPIFSIDPGHYNDDINVGIYSNTEAARIHYTIDGSAPTDSSAVYTGPISIRPHEGDDAIEVTIKAFAVKSQMENSEVLSDTFVVDYTLRERQLNVVSGANGSVTPSGMVTVFNNVPRSISASPASGYHFLEWEKTAGTGTVHFVDSESANTEVTVVGGDATIQASFAINRYNLTITGSNCSPTPSGTIEVNHGASTSVSANPQSGYNFSNWTIVSGSGVVFGNSGTSSTTVTLTNGDATIRANASINTYTLTVGSGPNGTSWPIGNVTVNHGVPRSISASPSAGYMFDNWVRISGTGVSFADADSASTAVTLTGGNATVRAYFKEWQGTKTVVSIADGGDRNDIAIADPYIYMVYQSGTHPRVRFIRSGDNGATWSSPVNLQSSAGGRNTAIAAAGNYVYVLAISSNNVSVARSWDNGDTWHFSTVDSGLTSSDVGRGVSIATSDDGRRIYISYIKDTQWKTARSANHGVFWELLPGAADGEHGINTVQTSIACSSDGQIVVSAYHANGNVLVYRRSENYGGSWSNYRLIDSGTVGRSPSIAYDNGMVLISYFDVSNSRIKVHRRLYSGGTPQTQIYNVADVGTMVWQSQGTSITRVGGTTYLAYRDGNTLRFTRSTTGTWPASSIRTVDNTMNTGLGIAAGGNRAFISYHRDGIGLRFARSNDQGDSW